MITNNFPEKYLATLKDPIKIICRCNPIQLPKHLCYEYVTITSQDLTKNYTRMSAQWNHPTSIEDLFLQICDGQDFATDGQEIISDSQLLRLCYNNISSTSLLNSALKLLRDKVEANKTYALLCSYMTVDHKDIVKNQLNSEVYG